MPLEDVFDNCCDFRQLEFMILVNWVCYTDESEKIGKSLFEKFTNQEDLYR